ncbi:MAG: TolC family protein [Myxococcales bacterium]|nr:TolC family protein [Myxococcales bacterium]MCB9752271.1 TolC family protein [Myxococcales bacterium]
MPALTPIVVTALLTSLAEPAFDRSGQPTTDGVIKPAPQGPARTEVKPSTSSPLPSTTRPSTAPTSPRPTATSRPLPPPGQLTPTTPSDGEGPQLIDDGELPTFNVDANAPFATESLELSEVLKLSLEQNIDLRSNVYDVAISEANILAAMGAYDVFIRAGATATLNVTPQRGSAFVLSTGSRSLSANFGINRKIETGGTVDFSFSMTRGLASQPVSIFNPDLGSIELAQYTVAPTLTLTHPLLKGAGIKVNRADIDKARLAKSQTEATQMVTAQTVVRDILNAYWEVLYAHRDLVNKRRALELTGEQIERTRAEVAAGRRSPIELRSIEQTRAQQENDLLLAENNLIDRSLTLRTLMGQDLAELEVLGVTPTTDPQAFQPEPYDHKAQIERAMEANPQIRQLQLAIASRQIDELVAANQRLPQLDFQGTFAPQGRSIDRSPNIGSGDPGEKSNWANAFRNIFTDDLSNGLLADYRVSASLNLTWDVQNRAAKGNHQRAILELHKAQANLDITRQQISGSVIRAANTLRNAAKRMEVSDHAVELAQENLEAEKARYAVGRSTAYDVLFRLDALEIAEANALRAQIDYLQAKTELQVLTGDLLPSYGLEVVSQMPPPSVSNGSRRRK